MQISKDTAEFMLEYLQLNSLEQSLVQTKADLLLEKDKSEQMKMMEKEVLNSEKHV